MDHVSRAQIEPQNRLEDRRKATQFKPGVSGNPGGRPKKAHITKIYEKILSKAKNRKEIEEAILSTLTSGRMAGVLLLREAAERTEGRVTQTLEVNSGLASLTDGQLAEKLVKIDEEIKKRVESLAPAE